MILKDCICTIFFFFSKEWESATGDGLNIQNELCGKLQISRNLLICMYVRLYADGIRDAGKNLRLEE